MARTDYSDETKAAVLAALLAGQAVGEIASEYKIPAPTIRSWKTRQAHGGGVATVATQKKERIGDLLVTLVETEIETLRQLSVAARNVEWIIAQTAEGMAVFSGVKYDKLTRMLEAFGRSEEDDERDPTAAA